MLADRVIPFDGGPGPSPLPPLWRGDGGVVWLWVVVWQRGFCVEFVAVHRPLYEQVEEG